MARRAVLIGRNSGRLEHCPRDVNLMREALHAHGFECEVIPSGHTLGRVTDSVAAVIDTCRPQDTLVVYFSGHAYGEDGLQLVLTDPMNRQANRLQGTTLVGLLRGCQAQSKLLILDSCQAGQAVVAADDWPSQPGDHFRILTASDGRSRTREDDDLQAGVFTFHLHRALTDPSLCHSGPGGVLDLGGHLSVDSIDPWLRRAVCGYKRVEGGQEQAEPQLYGSTAKGVFFAYDLAPPPSIAPPETAPSAAEPAASHDGLADDHWLLKTLDRNQPLQTLQGLLGHAGTPQLALVDAVYQRDWPGDLADCAMFWPERGGAPLPALDERHPPSAYGFQLWNDAAEPRDLYLALHGALIPYARDPDRPEQAVCTELRGHRHLVLRCMLEITRPSHRPLRLLRLAERFLADLCRREPELAVVLLVVCQPAGADWPWWWPLWTRSARLILRGRVHWIGRLGPVTGNEVAAWWDRWPAYLQADPRLRRLHEAQLTLLNQERRALDYAEVRDYVGRVWQRRLSA